MISHFDWQLVHILPIEVVPDVVIAGTVIATEVSRERGEDPSRGELQEPAVRDGVEAMAPRPITRSTSAFLAICCICARMPCQSGQSTDTEVLDLRQVSAVRGQNPTQSGRGF
jgi:hypothetical protein